MRSKPILSLALLVVGLVLGGFGLSLLLSADQYQAWAKIYLAYLESDSTNNPSFSPPSYDSSVIQNTFEIIPSPLILSNVIANLKLDEIWSRKYFKGAKLKTPEAVAIINRRLSLAPVRGTRLIAIEFASEDPNEAAQVANAIAETYWDYRTQSLKELAKQQMPVLQQRFRDEVKQLQESQAKVDSLKQQFSITNDFPPAGLMQHIEQSRTYPLAELPGQAYWPEKQKLDQMTEAHKLLALRMEADKADRQLPRTSLVHIADHAVPPTKPIGPNRFLGGGLAAAGLVLLISGWVLLKPTGQHPA